MTDTPAAPATLPEAVRAMVIEAVPDWIARGGDERALQEWEGVLSHPKTAPALEELAANGELFTAFFLKLMRTEGFPTPPRHPTSWSFGQIFNARDDQLPGFAETSYVLWQMAALLLIKFRTQ